MGQKRYVLIKFFTKWCQFCQLLSPEYERLVDIINNTRKDIIIGRVDVGNNDITKSRYGIRQFPIVALFFPGSKRIHTVYQGLRKAEEIADWLNQLCPKIEIKEDEEIIIKEENDINENNEKSDESSLEIDMDKIKINKDEITTKNEFIKEEFFELQKKLDEIEYKIDNKTNINAKNKIKPRRHKRIRIIFDFNMTNIFVTGITLLIIFAFYQTGRKLLINSGIHKY